MGSEENRIEAVYENYAKEPEFRERWNPQNPGNQAIAAELWRAIEAGLSACGDLSLAKRKVLDLGCGCGGNLSRLLSYGAEPQHLFGVDLVPARIERAKSSWPELQFWVANGKALAFQDGTFDYVMLFTVFSSILDREVAGQVATEVVRVLRPGGVVIWYDMRRNNPWNPNVRGLDLGGIRKLFPQLDLRLQSLTVLPPVTRRLGIATARLYPMLARLPLLRSHYLGFFLRKADCDR